MSVRMPVGVCGMIAPWNFPMAIPSWKLLPAVVCGNTCVIKPANETPLSTLNLIQALVDAGLPPGVVNYVTGSGTDVGVPLVEHPQVRAISFTGSSEVGSRVGASAAAHFKPCSLEMGGKNAMIVMDDANLDLALDGALWGAFGTTGQRCTATSRVVVHRDVAKEFTKKLVQRTEALKVGDGLDESVQVGPQVNRAQIETSTRYCDIGKKEGAKLLTGGKALTKGAYAKGHFFAPTVFAKVKPNMRIAQEEIFGPVISAIPFKDMDELVRRANSTMFGLGSGVWTRDVSKAHALAKAIRAGSVWVNCYQAMDPAVPFGGYKMSGYGRESGLQQMEEYLNVKAVWIKTA
jgi:alpha-ketoglutaric semialdehyde dehydrogenase